MAQPIAQIASSDLALHGKECSSLASRMSFRKELYFQANILLKFLGDHNIFLKLDSNYTESRLSSLTETEFQKIVFNLSVNNSDIIRNDLVGVSFRDTIQSLWNIFSKYGWRLDDEFVSRIKNTDVVEIYLPDGTQIYRNLEYFNKTSYSLIDLLVYPWYELIDHNADAVAKFLGISAEIFSNENVGRSIAKKYYRLDPYTAKEKFSAEQYTAQLTSQFILPIRRRDSGISEAFMAVWNINVLDQKPGSKTQQEELVI